MRVGDVASKDTDGRLLSGVFWSRDRGGEPTDIKAGDAVVTASTACGVTMGTRSAGLEMEPRRRGDLIIVPVRMYASSKSRRSVVRAGSYHALGVSLAPRINGPATERTIGSSFVNGALYVADAASHESISRRIPRLLSGLGLRAFPEREKRQRSGGRFVASDARQPCARASRAAAKIS